MIMRSPPSFCKFDVTRYNLLVITIFSGSSLAPFNFFLACGGELTSELGRIASPSYPNNYPPGTECEWTVGGSPGNRVSFRFINVDIEESAHCNSDYVQINQDDSSGVLLGHYCGSDLPTNLTVANKLWIKFRSDRQGSAPGFIAEYSLGIPIFLCLCINFS